MLEAATRMRSAERTLYDHARAHKLYDATLDPNRTGLIGVESSLITTTLGSIPAKRAATNPDFAAYVVRVLKEHKISMDDSVIVTMTGSFPGLNLAVTIALETLGIPSLKICSLGASSYGANQEEYSWIDMEDVLFRAGKLSMRSNFVTLGAVGDVGGGLPDEGVELLRQTSDRLGYPLLESATLKAQTALRRKLLGSPKSYGLLINIGGNHAMLGKGLGGRELPGGWIDPSRNLWQEYYTERGTGLIFDFLNDGVPVLNLLHVEEIANEAGIPFDPIPLPRIGKSDVYYKVKSKR
jgi:poly-gamma-glutamate system protein